jgi:hypothetical protein
MQHSLSNGTSKILHVNELLA